MAEEEVSTAAQLRTPRRPLTLPRVPVGFPPSTQCRCATSAEGWRIRGSVIRHLECVRIGRVGFASLRSIHVGQHLHIPGHTPL